MSCDSGDRGRPVTVRILSHVIYCCSRVEISGQLGYKTLEIESLLVRGHSDSVTGQSPYFSFIPCSNLGQFYFVCQKNFLHAEFAPSLSHHNWNSFLFPQICDHTGYLESVVAGVPGSRDPAPASLPPGPALEAATSSGRSQPGSGRSSCEYQQQGGGYPSPGPARNTYYRGYQGGYYHYQQYNGGGGGYRGAGGGMGQQGDQYPAPQTAYSTSYPGYSYEQAQVYPGQAAHYPAPYTKQTPAFSEQQQYPAYTGDGKGAGAGAGYYSSSVYSSCQAGPAPVTDPSTANTPLPPDFSYVGAGAGAGHHQPGHAQDPAAYSDFYAMG